MTDYFFDLDSDDSTNPHAEVDQLLQVRVYLQTFNDPLPHLMPQNLEKLQICMLEEVFIHEDLHVEIAKEVDTTGEQEHSTVYQWIGDWLNCKGKDSDGY